MSSEVPEMDARPESASLQMFARLHGNIPRIGRGSPIQ